MRASLNISDETRSIDSCVHFLLPVFLSAVLGFAAAPVQAACNQIAPNPNPAGTQTGVDGPDACNEVTFENFGTLTVNPAPSLTNSGTLNNNSGATLSMFLSTLYNSGTLNNSAGAEVQGSDRLVRNLSGGTINNAGLLSLSGFVNEAGALLNNSGRVFDDTSQRSNGVINNTGSYQTFGFQNNGTFNNEQSGTLTVGPGFLPNDFTNTGVVNNAGTWSVPTAISNTGVINNTGSFSFGVLDNSGTVGNSGTLRSSSQINNSGQFTITATGAVNGGGTYTQTAGKTIVDGSMTQAAVNINGGLLQGSGTIFAPVTVDGGTISAGHSPGTLNIGGDLTFNSGLLLTEIAGVGPGQFDLLKMAGKVSILGGTLGFSFGDFLPQAGDQWTFLTGDGGIELGSFSTTFSFTDPDAGQHFLFDVELDSTGKQMNLIVAAIPEPAVYAQLLAGIVVIGFMLGLQRRKQKAWL